MPCRTCSTRRGWPWASWGPARWRWGRRRCRSRDCWRLAGTLRGDVSRGLMFRARWWSWQDIAERLGVTKQTVAPGVTAHQALVLDTQAIDELLPAAEVPGAVSSWRLRWRRSPR